MQIGSSKLQMEEQETETLLPQVHNSEVMDSEVQIGSSKLQMEEQETETYSTHMLPSLVTYNQACIHQTLTKRRSVASAKERSISCCLGASCSM